MSVFLTLAGICRRLVDQAAFFAIRELAVGDSRIRICCVDFEPSEIMLASVKDFLIPTGRRAEGTPEEVGGSAPERSATGGIGTRDPAETFYWIRRPSPELRAALPREIADRQGRVLYTGEEGRYAVSAEFGFFSLYSRAENATYIWVCPDLKAQDVLISHPFRMELGWWALRNSRLFLHGAVIGISRGSGQDGEGILLAGAGGSGKSTLAMTSFLAGMSLVTDDYLLVTSGPCPVAERIYSTAYLRGDMLERLPEFRRAVIWTSEERDKHLIALDALEGRVADRLPLSAVVMPCIAHAEAPRICRDPDIRTRIPLIASTSYQNRELKNREVFMRMMRLLRSVPAFDYYLTDDLRANAEYLKRWAEEEGWR